MTYFDSKNPPDPNSLSMGEWGTTYHYTISVYNLSANTYTLKMQMKQSEGIIIGTKNPGESDFTVGFYEEAGELIVDLDDTTKRYQDWKTRNEVTLPPNEVTTFEVITMLAGGAGGTQHRLIVER